MILDKQSIFEIKIIFDIQKMTNLWEFKVLNLFFTKEPPGFEPGTLRVRTWNSVQWPNFKLFYLYDFSQKSKVSNLNNFKIGGVFLKTKTISKFSYYRRFLQYNWFWGRPPDFRAIKLRKSISYAKSAYFMKLGLYPSS